MDERAAIAQVRSGDAEAFRLLVERHGRALYRLAYRMTGTAHDAEDVVQDAFLKAYRSIDRFDGRSQVGSWLYRITANCAFDLLRERQRRERHIGSVEDGTKPEPPGLQPGPDRLAIGGEVRRRIEVALARMSARERAAFVLRHFEGQSIREIGHALDLDTEAVKQSVCRAVHKARQVLRPLAGAS
jgi:RNA polymerase sigma-70 factor (ECF subfamily)